MSDVSGRGMTRRGFLHAGLAVAGGIFALGPPRGLAGTERGHARWAFLSDTHIAADREDNYRGSYPYQNLQKAVAQISSDLPAGVVVTGDLARLTGQMGDYENFQKLLVPLTSRRPAYLALGNHDNRNNFLDVFENAAGKRQAVKGKHVLTVDAGPVRFILLDSLMQVNETPGLLGKAQRTWLGNYLRTCDDRPTILFFHHSLRDEDGDLLDALRLFEIIRPIRKVKALVYGHSHEYGLAQFEGIHLINLPATAYTFNGAQPLGWVEAQLTPEGGEFILHAVGGNGESDGRSDKLSWRS